MSKRLMLSVTCCIATAALALPAPGSAATSEEVEFTAKYSKRDRNKTRGGISLRTRFTITDPSGRRLSGYELSAHLIRDHGFFGGPDTRYRLEPAEVAGILGLTGET